MRKAILAGSFDPITNGHLDIIKRSAFLYDEVHVVIGTNPDKTPLFHVDKRKQFIKNSLNEEIYPNVVVGAFDGLLSEYAYENGIQTIVKGLRNPSDFEMELTLSSVNRDARGVETMFMPCKPEFFNVSSSMVKAIVKEGGNVEKYVPLEVKSALEKTIGKINLIGVVGNSGSGKSSFIMLLLSHYAMQGDFMPMEEFCYINTDELAHGIYDSQAPYCLDVKYKIVDYFGEAVRDGDSINRRLLAQIVFGNEHDLNVLNKLMENPLRHAIYERIKKSTYEFRNWGRPVPVFIEGAMIPEFGFLPLVNNNIIYLQCEGHEAVERIMKRDNITEIEARQRLQAQTPDYLKKNMIKQSIITHNFGRLVESDGTVDPTELYDKYLFIK